MMLNQDQTSVNLLSSALCILWTFNLSTLDLVILLTLIE